MYVLQSRQTPAQTCFMTGFASMELNKMAQNENNDLKNTKMH